MAIEFLTQLFSFLVIITNTRTEVSLVPSNNVSLCFGSSITLRCTTTEQSLLWTSNAENRLFNDINQPTTSLGNFTLNVVSVTSNGTSLSVTSTATLVNFQFTSSGLKIECKELMTMNPSMEATLIAAGPPPPPQNLIIQESVIGNFIISWSQSNCAVQYVVTIISLSDDRVYSNITTSNTNTTVTLPTGVEFCVTLVAVDSIGRRGPDTIPVCNSQAVTRDSTVTPSPIVTHSPAVMVRGVNVAAAVAIPVLLVLLLLVIGVVVGATLLIRKHRKEDNVIPIKPGKEKEYLCEVFCKNKGINRWKFVLIFLLKSETKKVKKVFAEKGYAKEGSKVSLRMFTTNESIRIETADISSESEWHMEFDHQQVINKADLETIANTDLEITKYSYIRAKITASTECTSPDDLHFSVNLVGTTNAKLHLINIKKKAKKRCACQVCYHKPNDNCWRTTFAFLPEKMLEKLEDLEYYQDANFGDTVFFYFQAGEIVLVANHESEKWNVDYCSKDKVSRAAVEGYTGVGVPPCIVMMLRTVTDEITLPDLTLPVTVNGAQDITYEDGKKVENNSIQIKRAAEFSAESESKISAEKLAQLMCTGTKYICKVLVQKIKSQNNCWEITLAFVPGNRQNEMENIYQHLHFVKEMYVSFTYFTHWLHARPTTIKPQNTENMVTKGWKVTIDESYREVKRIDVVSYTGRNEPPRIVMTLTADRADVDDAEISMTFTGIKEPNNKLEFSIKAEKIGSLKFSSV